MNRVSPRAMTAVRRPTRSAAIVADIKRAFLDALFSGLGRVPAAATPNDL